MTRQPIRLPFGRYLPPMGSAFVSVEVLGGVVLLAATVAALTWANLAPGSYADVWSTELTIGLGDQAITESLEHWVNDGLMTVFFFVVGLEIKRELVRGELRDPRAASLPVIAAIGGMVVPALLYLAVNTGGPGGRGWAIPMATDIAFAVAVLAIVGSRVPGTLKLFLLSLAIVDDVGAIIVIALFYSSSISGTWLLGAAGAVTAIFVLQRLHVRHALAYVVPAVGLWVCVLESGVHATIAGVALGLLTPARPFMGRTELIEGLEARIHPWSSFVIVPIFALANAGVQLSGDSLTNAWSSSIALGIILGLVIGKPLGIVTSTALALHWRLGRLPTGVRLVHVLAAGAAAGIGFTVSLFVANLSYSGALLEEAKVAILGASVISGVIGILLLRWTGSASSAPDPRR
jgi:NhaA family Na+:H+ antiporter